MGKGKLLHMGILSATVLAVAGCEDGTGFNVGRGAEGPATAAAGRPAQAKLVERDVEAPDVFSAKEAGLWDGRPSLGGVWVAHPSVTDPERVLVRNPENGKSVIGALFKRERDNPGPKLQVSSDAANALGLLPGAPTNLSVVALVREEVPQAAPAAAVMAETIEAPETIEQKSLDAPLTAAAAAIDAAETGTEGAVKIGEATTIAAADGAAKTNTKAKKGFWNRLKSKSSRRQEADEVIAAAGPANAPAPLSAMATPEIAPAASSMPVVKAAAPAPATTPKAQKPSGKNYIQIGIFSVEENASRTASNMRKAGIVPTVYAQESRGKKFWRVVIGPAQSSADRQVLLKKVKAMGFQDAYFVTN